MYFYLHMYLIFYLHLMTASIQKLFINMCVNIMPIFLDYTIALSIYSDHVGAQLWTITGCVRDHGPGCITLDNLLAVLEAILWVHNSGQFTRDHGPGFITLDNLLSVLEAMALGS